MSLERVTVHQVIVGYVDDTDGYKATGSVSLIREGPLQVLVDCGDPWNGEELVNKLMEEGTACSKITHVVVTHGHVDHCANINLFKNAQIFMGLDYVGPNGIYNTINREKGYAISESIKIQVLKGHTSIDLIVKVENTVDGVIIIAGDLFESEHDEGKWQQVSEFPEDQELSRKLIRESSDIIIPGHGPLFSA